MMLQGTKIGNISSLSIIPFGSARVLWTLSVEWWFYLLFGYIFLSVFNKEKATFVRIIALAVLILMPIEYLISGRGNGLGLAFSLGILLFYVYSHINIKYPKRLAMIGIIVYLIYGFYVKDAYTVYSFFALAVIMFLLLKGGEQ